jgi:protein-disulfide isomerase
LSNRLIYLLIVLLVVIGTASVISFIQIQDLSDRLSRIELNQQKNQIPISISDNVDIDVDKGFMVGNVEARVTLVIFMDYQCDYCKYFFRELYPKLSSDYIEKGLVKFVVMDYPLTSHQYAVPIAKYARCAQEIGTYFEFVSKIFNNTESLDDQTLDQIALESGIDCKKCNASSATIDIIFENIQIGNSVGVNRTPTFVLNNQLFVGVKPYAEFESMINDVLNAN